MAPGAVGRKRLIPERARLPTGASDRRLIMAKAHGFERIRLAYHDAIATAGV